MPNAMVWNIPSLAIWLYFWNNSSIILLQHAIHKPPIVFQQHFFHKSFIQIVFSFLYHSSIIWHHQGWISQRNRQLVMTIQKFCSISILIMNCLSSEDNFFNSPSTQCFLSGWTTLNSSTWVSTARKYFVVLLVGTKIHLVMLQCWLSHFLS